MKTRPLLKFALIAVLVLALGAAGYLLFSPIRYRTPAPEESFRISWEDGPQGYLEWTDAKLVLTFPDTPESREISFRPGWLPEEMASLQTGEWTSRMTAELLCLPSRPEYVPAYEDMSLPLLIDAYSMSQFNGDGAMLLLLFTPGEIREEHWDEFDADVLLFPATVHADAQPEIGMPEYSVTENYIVMANPQSGWILRVCGELDMETLVRVAKNLEIRETGRILRAGDFANPYTFIDGAVG